MTSLEERREWWSPELQDTYARLGKVFLEKSGLLTPKTHWLLYRWSTEDHRDWGESERKNRERLMLQRDRVPILFRGLPSGAVPLAYPDRVERYFRYARSVIEGPSKHWTQDGRRGNPHMQAIPPILRGRIKAGVACDYEGAIAAYAIGEARLGDLAWRARDPTRRNELQSRELVILGFLFHEMSNALAMKGDITSREYAAASLGCYDELLEQTSRKDLRRVAEAGRFRAEVLLKQSASLFGIKDEADPLGDLRVDEEAAIQSATLVGGGVDHYGLAKAWHFQSLAEWFHGRYELALDSGRHAVTHAELMDDPWRGMGGLAIFKSIVLEAVRTVEARTVWSNGLFLWWIRDAGEYGRAWWQAITTATLADITACAGRHQHDSELLAQADRLYRTNSAIRASLAQANPLWRYFRSVDASPTSVGMYRFLLEIPRVDLEPSQLDPGTRARTLTDLGVAQALADTVPVAYGRVLTRAARGWLLGGRASMSAEDQAELHRAAEASNSPALQAFVRANPLSFAPTPVKR